MSRDDDTRFEPRLGRPRSSGEGRAGRPPTSFKQQVLRAVARAGGNPRLIGRAMAGRAVTGARTGRFNARGRGSKLVATFPRESGWSRAEGGMRYRARRVVVKARVVKMRGSGSKAAYAHLRYLQRDGATLDGERGRLYSASLDHADGSKFLDRGQDDRHQFRLIVAPEDGAELGDLRDFTRELMAQMEHDLQTQLDWVAVDHHNTGHPHSHVVIRGVTDDGKILNIAGDYIAHGIRHRASEIVTLELGMQSEWEVQQKLGREVEQDRFTRLDRAILQEVNDDGLVDLRIGKEQSYLGRVNRTLLIGRLKKLERMGLAREEEPMRWSLTSGMEKTLREMGERGDIIKTIHRALTERGLARGAGDFAIHAGRAEQKPTVGKVIGKGLAGDELTGRLHLVIDAADGRVHYVELSEALAGETKIGSIVEVGRAEALPRPADRNIAELARENGAVYEPAIHLLTARDEDRIPDGNYEGYVEAHVRRLEALRRAGIVERLDDGRWRIPDDFENRARDYDTNRSKQLGARVLSLIDLDAQVTASAATWLDRELVAGAPVSLRDGGFGREARDALARRRQWLIAQGLAREDGGKIVYRCGMLSTLARREVEEAGKKLARERGLPFRMAENGERISGTYRQSVQLVSGKYALVERSREFTLVPWRPVIEKALGRQVAGLVRGDGISWEFGRKRGLSIGM
jgi:type IV secretory pathway VirD2 relaxase